ncbi:MAG: hypothetical protein MUC96_07030 [Myxococcaceae bacterium]|nr:hypothetical protein [Myxococcaceae bacterium]
MLSATGVGIGAGAVMLAALAFASIARGDGAAVPLHFMASVVLGASALTTSALESLLVGSLVNIAISALDGWLYANVIARLPASLTSSWPRVVGAGLAFGAALYVVSLQLVARVALPWMLEAHQLDWFVGNTFVFGPVLAVMYELGVRRERARVG